MGGLLAALGFLTVIPLPTARAGATRGLADSVPFFPVVGLLIGAAVAGLAAGFARLLPSPLLPVVLVIALAAVSGGLHLDGLCDTADGFLSRRSRERTLEIMRDSRIGAFGCLALVAVLGLKVASLAALPPERVVKAALLAPLAGRCVMVGMLCYLPYARPEGLATAFCRERHHWEAPWAALVLLAAAWFAAGPAGLIAAGAAAAGVAAFGALCLRKIGGMTGDTAGASCEIAETLALAVLTLQPLAGIFR